MIHYEYNRMEFDSGNGMSPESDTDDSTVDSNEINELFSSCPHVQRFSVGPNYVLHLAGSNETTNPYVAAALSNLSCEVLAVTESEINTVARFKEHKDKIVDCKFSTDNNSLLYTGSTDGSIKLWDLREPEQSSAVNFLDTTLTETSTVKPINCFDISPNNRLLAAGTDLTEGDAFILFWDIRNTKLLGGYWESHEDDITQVRFHPEDSNKLISGSTDGLINLYDLSKTCEDDSLEDTLNTEALVDNLLWFNLHGKYRICCVTSTSDLQLWDLDGADPYKRFTRGELGKELRIKEDNTYIAKVLQTRNSLLLFGGNKGRGLRSLHINDKINCGFQFPESRQRVRAAWYNENTNFLATGGEDGKIDIWKPDVSVLNFKAEKWK